jgi:hypothetical protein
MLPNPGLCELTKTAVKRQLGSFSRLIPGLPSEQTSCTVYKLIVIIAAAMPAILLLRAIFVGRSQKASRAFSEFKKQIDYLVWVILFVIGCGFVYSVASLIHSMWK